MNLSKLHEKARINILLEKNDINSIIQLYYSMSARLDALENNVQKLTVLEDNIQKLEMILNRQQQLLNTYRKNNSNKLEKNDFHNNDNNDNTKQKRNK